MLNNYLSKDNTAVMQQVGWLGATGTYYKLDTPPTSEQEPGSYTPVYEQVGVWEWNDEVKEWRVHYD